MKLATKILKTASICSLVMLSFCAFDTGDARGATDQYTYNRDAAVSYAKTWFALQNPAYYAYSQDCANFTSQCMQAGGLPTSADWNARCENGTWQVSEAWRLAREQFEYFSNPNNGYTSCSVIKADNYSQLDNALFEAERNDDPVQPGDLLFTARPGSEADAINHATIITKVNGGPNPSVEVASHSSPRFGWDSVDILRSNTVFIVRLNTTNEAR